MPIRRMKMSVKKWLNKPTAFLLAFVFAFSMLSGGLLPISAYAAADPDSGGDPGDIPMEASYTVGPDMVSGIADHMYLAGFMENEGNEGMFEIVDGRDVYTTQAGAGSGWRYIWLRLADGFREIPAGDMTVAITYFDASTAAGSVFNVWYAGDSAQLESGEVTLTGANQWKTAYIPLPGSRIRAGLTHGTDFRLTVRNTVGTTGVSFQKIEFYAYPKADPNEPGEPEPDESPDPVSVTFTDPPTENGLDFTALNDSGTTPGGYDYIEGKPAYVVTRQEEPDGGYVGLLWFKAGEEFANAAGNTLTAVIEYYDDPALAGGQFEVWHNNGAGGSWNSVTLSGSGEWKEAYIVLDSFVFRGINNANDFRITVKKLGMAFHKVILMDGESTPPVEGRSRVTFGGAEDETVAENFEWSGHEGLFGTFGTVAGETAYTVPGSEGWNYIWSKVERGFQTGDTMTLAVTYYDGDPDAENKSGRWQVWYRDSDWGDHWTNWYNLGYTGEWKTEEIVLRNVDFNNVSINGGYTFRFTNQGGSVSVHEIEAINGGGDVDFGDAAYIEFGNNAVNTSGLSYWTGDSGDGGTFKTAGDPPQWGYEVNGAGKSDIYIYLNIDDGYMYGGKNKVEIEVEYYDGPSGYWSVAYDGVTTPWVYQDAIDLHGSGQWLTKTLVFDDLAMTNRCNGADLRFEAHSGVIVRSVSVRKIDTVVVEAKASKEAGVFFDTDDVKFDLKYTNETSSAQNLIVSIDAVNPDGVSIYNTTEIIAASEKQVVNETLNLDKLPKGSYFLNVNVKAGDINITEKYRFGVIKDLTNKEFTFFGWGACAHYGQGQDGIDIIKKLYKQAGVTSIRDEYYWGSVEQTPGQYNIDTNNWVKTLGEEGIRPLLILCYDNSLYQPTYGQAWLEAYGRYAEEMARAYTGVVDCFEVWNEFNGSFGNGRSDTYYNLLKYAYEGVKRGNSDATVVACGVVGYDDAFIKAVARQGEPGKEGWRYMEAVSYHYPNRDQITRCAEDIKQAIVDISGGQYETVMGKPYPEAWITEIGWSTKVPGGETEAQQAAYIAQMYLELAWSGATEMTYYYDFRNDGINPAEHEQNFGVVDVTGAPKPAFVALNNLADLINGRTAGQRWTNVSGKANLNINEFKGVDGDDDLYVIWSRVGEQSFSLNLGTEQFAVIDSYGNAVPYSSQDGSINITAGELPICVTGRFDTAPVVGDASFTSAQNIVYVTPGEEVSFGINRGGSAAALSGVYDIQLPLGWTVVSGQEFSPGQQDVITVRISDDYTAQTGRIVVTAKSLSGETYATVNITTSTVDAFVIEAYPVAKSTGDGWDVAVKLNNNYNTASIPNGSFRVSNPHQSSGVYLFDEIPPHDYAEILVPAPWLSGDFTTPFDFTVTAGSGSGAIIKNVSRTLSALTAVKADTQISVDGSITGGEWDGAMSFALDTNDTYRHVAGREWQGTDDLSVEGKVKWDDEYLYVAVGVADDSHHNTSSPDTWWMGDGIQLCIDPYRSFNSHSNTGFEFFGFALSSASPGVTSYLESHNVQGVTPGEGLLSAVIRDETNKKTYYEMGFKWSSILPPAVYSNFEPGYTDIGFSMLVNDNDGELRTGWQQYMDGIGYGRNPAQWGDLILTDLTSFNAPTPPNPNDPDYWKVPAKPNPPFVPQQDIEVLASTPVGGQGQDPSVLFDSNIDTRYEDGNQNVHPKFLVIDLGAQYDVDEIWYRTQRDYNGGAIFKYSVWVGDSLEGIDELMDFNNVRGMTDEDFASLAYLSGWTRVADNAAAPSFIFDEFLVTTETIGEYRLMFPDGAHAVGRYLTLLVHETRYDDWRMAELNVHGISPTQEPEAQLKTITYDWPPVRDGISSSNDGDQSRFTTIEGKTAYKMSGDYDELKVDVDTTYFGPAAIAVEYLDIALPEGVDSGGIFYMHAPCEGGNSSGWSWQFGIPLTGTNEWKTATFTFDGERTVDFDNRFNGNDFALIFKDVAGLGGCYIHKISVLLGPGETVEPVEPVDKTALDALIGVADTKAEADYTEETWAVFAAALSAAKSVSADADAAQGEVDEAKAALEAAMEALEAVEPADVTAKLSVSAETETIYGSPVEFVISMRDLKQAANVAVEFEVDGTKLAYRDFEALNGFIGVDTGDGAVTWTELGDGMWKGRVLLMYLNNNEDLTATGPIDIARILFDALGLGDVSLKVTSVRLAGFDESGEAVFLECEVERAEAATTVVKVYSPYDLNKNDIIDQLDLVIAQRFYQAREGDDGWDAAKIADVNNDGIVNMADLINIVLNFSR